jgi:hypothetical protein
MSATNNNHHHMFKMSKGNNQAQSSSNVNQSTGDGPRRYSQTKQNPLISSINAERINSINSNSKKRKASRSNSRPVSANKKKDNASDIVLRDQKYAIPSFAMGKGAPIGMTGKGEKRH